MAAAEKAIAETGANLSQQIETMTQQIAAMAQQIVAMGGAQAPTYASTFYSGPGMALAA